jgi:fibronectin-binding autotransporter adhesin
VRIPRSVGVSAVLGLLVCTGLAWTPAASAATPQCRVINAASAARYASLQAAQDAAGAGATLWLRGTCTGSTEVTKNLTVTGQQRRGFTAPILKGAGPGTVLKLRSGVTLTVNTLAITGGKAFRGGGIFVNTRSSLTLNNVTVSGNAANFTSGGILGSGGGIFNNGTLSLNDSTTITGNTALSDGGGIGSQGADATVTLNDSATITGNTAGRRGGGIFNWVGTVTLNGSAAITGNTAATTGGGIFNLCGTLRGAVAGARGNVFNNKPNDIVSACA